MARPIAKDHDAKRAHILRIAAGLFATEGFDRASMAQLAEACGISKANIYHYYNSKDALLFDILDSYLSDLRDRVCGLPLTGSPAEQLHALIQDILMAYQGSDHEHRVQITGIDRLPADQQKQLRGYQRDMVRQLSSLLAAVSPALAKDKTHLRNTTMSVFGMLNWYYMWNTGSGTAAREAYARQVAELTLRGVP